MTIERFVKLEDLIPEGAVPEVGIRLVSYITPDGNVAWAYRTTGTEDNLPALVGLLEMAKVYFLTGHDGTNDHPRP